MSPTIGVVADPVFSNSNNQSHALGWVDSRQLVDLMDMQNTWLGGAAARLMKSHPWDIFAMHAHCPDHCYHAFLNKLDPGVCSDRKVVAEYRAAERGFYRAWTAWWARSSRRPGQTRRFSSSPPTTARCRPPGVSRGASAAST